MYNFVTVQNSTVLLHKYCIMYNVSNDLLNYGVILSYIA